MCARQVPSALVHLGDVLSFVVVDCVGVAVSQLDFQVSQFFIFHGTSALSRCELPEPAAWSEAESIL